MSERTLYQVLMLDPSATHEVVTAVYRVLAKQYHPDRAGAEAADKMAAINEAYAILGDESKRLAYDNSLKAINEDPDRARERPTSAGRPEPVATTGRSRESAPGATNLMYESGGWAVRPPSEPTPAPPQYGDAGAPPAYLRQGGSVISFGRYRGWTVGQVAAYDRNYVEWLSRTMAGRTYRDELLQALGQSA